MATELCMTLRVGWMLRWSRSLEMEIGAGNLLALTLLWKFKVDSQKSGLVLLINLSGRFLEVAPILVHSEAGFSSLAHCPK